MTMTGAKGYPELRGVQCLTMLGVGDRLAISWIQQEPDSALRTTATYVERRAKRKQIRGSAGCYTRTSEKIKALRLIERQQFATEYTAQGGKGNTYQPDVGTL